MTTPSITDLLKYADLQMAAEAFLVEGGVLKSGLLLEQALTFGNGHASKFTELQATDFLKHWKVVDQQPNTETGFSGTLFQCIKDDPNTGAKAGELVMSLRSTEFVDDAARDNQATNDLEIKETGFAWGQIRDMEAWYAQLSAEGGQLAGQPFSVTGYSLGGHLATVFNLLHPGAAQQVVTFNGAGVGQVKAGNTLGALVQQFADLSTPKADGSGHFSYAKHALAAIYERVRVLAIRFKHSLKHTLNLALLGSAVLVLSACAGGSSASSRGIDKSRQETAIAMWKERCQKAGEFIHQTVEDVEGVYLMKIRDGINFGDQFKLDDPYGHDSTKEQLVMSFLRKEASPGNPAVIATKGYRYVVAKDLSDGQLYRFTGSWVSTRKKDVNSPWIQAELKQNPNFDLNIYDYVLQKAPPHPLPRYGVTWDDISTREEREYWIAGSSLRVIDLQTNKVIAERVGYMVDWAQGSKAGNRSPWLFAADTACPAFRDPSLPRRQPDASSMAGQTYRFVSKVLKPKQ